MYRERGITVKEALQLDVLRGGKVLAGANGLDRIITGVNVMEVPDIFDWVKKGEFILTTAYAIRHDAKAQIELIPEFNRRGLSALGIKTKRYIDRLPEEMIQIADRLNFPIIELPPDVSFTDIINPILTNIVNRQTALLLKIDNIHKELMNVLLEGGGLQEIARVLNQMVDNPLVIEDIMFGGKYCAGDREFLKEVNIQRPSDYLPDTEARFEEKVDIVANKEVKKRVLPIITGKKVYGFIHLWEVERPLTPIDLRVIESSLAITALEITKQISIFEVDRKYRNEFLEDLLSGDSYMCRVALERATFFGLEMDKDYVALVIKIKDLEDCFQKTVNNSHYLQYYKNSIIRIVDRTLTEEGKKGVIGSKSDQVTILVPVERGGDPGEIKEWMLDITKRIYKRITEEIPGSKIVAAVGKYYPGHDNIWKSYNTALRTLALSKYLNREILHFGDLGIYRLLCNDVIQPELEAFLQENLQPLLEYDKTKNGELIKTLEVFFKTNGNLKKVSELMYTHYNTILYRMQKIQELTKMDLNNHFDRLNLQVALSIMHIIS